MGGQAPPAVEMTTDSVTGGPHDLACCRCGQLAWPLQEGQCQVCVRLDLAFPLLGRQHSHARIVDVSV